MQMKLGTSCTTHKLNISNVSGKTNNLLRNKKFSLNKSEGMVMLEVIFDAQSIVCYKFIPQGHTVNKKTYVEIPCCLKDAVKRKHLEKWALNWAFLLNYNASGHWKNYIEECHLQGCDVM
jgi:hypothetical protein